MLLICLWLLFVAKVLLESCSFSLVYILNDFCFLVVFLLFSLSLYLSLFLAQFTNVATVVAKALGPWEGRVLCCGGVAWLFRHSLHNSHNYLAGLDPFDHSEGQFSLNVKKFEKCLEMGSGASRPWGVKKSEKSWKMSLKLTFSRLLNSFLTLFWLFTLRGQEAPRTHFETFFRTFSHFRPELPLWMVKGIPNLAMFVVIFFWFAPFLLRCSQTCFCTL